MPLSAVLIGHCVHDAIANGSGVFAHGYTYSGHPVATAAANAVLTYCEHNDVANNVSARSEQLFLGLNQLRNELAFIAEVRGRGLLIGVEFVDPDTGLPFRGGMAGSYEVVAAARRHGLLVYPCASQHLAAVLIAPPLTISDAEAQELLDRFRLALCELSSL